MPHRSHQQHHEDIPQTPRPWSTLNPDAEPWQLWSTVNNPLATGAPPSLYSRPLEQQNSCLRPYRHLKHFRTLEPHEPRSPRRVHFPEEAGAHYRPFSPTDPSDPVQDWYHHFNPYRLFRTLPPFWDPDEPRYAPLHQRLMLEFYRLQQLANQRGLLRDKYLYRVLPEPRPPGSKAAEILTRQDLARST